jgi:thiamine kinase-like enzyme
MEPTEVVIRFNEKISFKGENFKLVQVQREGISAIYKSEDGEKILRIGDKEKIEKDLANHQKLLVENYPVSQIIEDGEYNGGSYYIEQSFGENLLGKLFRQDFEKHGKITDENFRLLTEVSKRLLQSEIDNSSKEMNWESLVNGVHAEWLIDELPELKDQILERLKICKERLKTFPFAFSHGDFNPYNIFPGGVIDFEDGFYAPIIFDVYGLLVYAKYFPLKSEIELEINGAYTYFEEQMKTYISEMDKVLEQNGQPKGSDYIREIEFLKSIWLAVRMQKWPKMQEYRYKLFKANL